MTMLTPERKLALFLTSVNARVFERGAEERKGGMRFSVVKPSGWDAVEDAARAREISVLIIDVSLDRNNPSKKQALSVLTHYTEKVLALVNDNDSIEVMFDWFPVIQAGMRLPLRTKDLAGSGWVSRLAERPASALGKKVIERLGQQLELLRSRAPGTLRALEDVLTLKKSVNSVVELATLACADKHTVSRHCERAGLAAPNSLIRASKLIQAFPLLKESNLRIEEVTERCGWKKVERFTEHCKHIIGLTPGAIRTECTEEEFLDRIVAYVSNQNLLES